MSGFKDPITHTAPHRGDETAEWPTVDFSRAEIECVVDEARRQRSETIAAWLKHTFSEWASLWRRPGRAIPGSFRSPKANA